MNYRAVGFVAAFLALCATITVDARPDHPAMMLMSGETPHDVEPHNETMEDVGRRANDTSAEEADDDDDDDDTDDEGEDDEDDDDDDIHVEGKTAMCPARQPEIVEIEKYCLAEYKMMKKKINCTSTAMPPTTENVATRKPEPEAASLKMEMSTTEGTTEKPYRKPRSRSCHYYQCVLKKLEVLDEAGIPKKERLESWAVSNITDATQKEKTQERIKECLVKLKDEFEDAKNGTGSSEEEDHNMDEPHTKVHEQRKCETSKKLMCCLRHVECPVLKFP